MWLSKCLRWHKGSHVGSFRGTAVQVEKEIVHINSVDTNDIKLGDVLEVYIPDQRKYFHGLTMQLLSNSTAVAVLDPDLILRPSRMEVIFRNNRKIQIPIGNQIFGRTFDALGNDLNGIPTDASSTTDLYMDTVPSKFPQSIKGERKLHTGIWAVDLAKPLWDRRNIMISGPNGIGKTTLAMDVALGTRKWSKTPVKQIVVADVSNVKYYQKVFTEYSAIQDTAFVTTKPTDSSIKNLLAPFTAIIMAEEYCRKFHERYLIILDDLNAQASSFFSVQKQLKAFVPTTHWQDNTGVTRIYESPFESSCFLSTFFGKLFSRPNVEPGLITTIAIVETRDDRDKLPGYVTVENIAGQMMDQKIQLDHSVTQQENRKPAVVLKNIQIFPGYRNYANYIKDSILDYYRFRAPNSNTTLVNTSPYFAVELAIAKAFLQILKQSPHDFQSPAEFELKVWFMAMMKVEILQNLEGKDAAVMAWLIILFLKEFQLEDKIIRDQNHRTELQHWMEAEFYKKIRTYCK